ncbi:hypothetical protein GYMLUDRAFT_200426 [Collybiopsis luxurians FD-317 M1]|uniref:ATP-dependent DNA ligase family profile domain-containing protein n=1 Tax=Collybiopsis luxurians FD-317 M1 TaxID=944289 RepID=A0A0D0BXA6_9AGAR|nr:hypothetical protein GYMLUDRAFT_200426 [Collybiopsis luxurians FD-317 M1]
MSDGDLGHPLKFFQFAQLVQSIAKKSKPRSNQQRKANINREWSWSPAYEVFYTFSRRIQATPMPAGTTSIIFRFLFPEDDHKRKFGLRDKSLIGEVAEVLCMSQDRVDAVDKLPVSPGEKVQALLEATSPCNETYIGILGISDVDKLLNNLASTSPWSHSSFSTRNLSRHLTKEKHTRKSILRTLYRKMSPLEAAVLTQIILKDLRPLLYPQLELDSTTALRDYNTKAVKILIKESAMRAWDLSNRMNKSYRMRWDLDDAAKAFESGYEVGPEIGYQIGVPKSQKGRSCKHALSFFSNSSQVWAETKYDGERAQIHVQVRQGQKPQITIFSKSKRESTDDRRALHDVILDCLGLNGQPGVKPRVKRSAILDAEMVPFEGTQILEFWRIRRLIRETAVGVRGRWSKKINGECLVDSDNESESSLKSNAEGQHLGLIFFDIMYLEDESLIQQPYYRRREILEKLIITQPGQAILADRWLIDIHNHSPNDHDVSDEDDEDDEDDGDELDEDGNPARGALRKVLARKLAFGEEGLVLKAAESEYNEYGKPWVKLKKDYIEGLGDTLDLVLLAAANVSDRALELRVPLTTMTTFYIGAQTNKSDTMNDPTLKPHFYIYFTAAYGLSRAELESLNFLIKTDDPVECDSDKKQPLPCDELEYTFYMYDKLARPQFMLREPIAVELFGDRFTVSEGSEHYELRWPRITKYFRRHDRSWRDCLSLQELHVQAREAMGRVSANEIVQKQVEITFDSRVEEIDHNLSGNMRARTEMWKKRLAEADRPKQARRKGNDGQKGRQSSKQVESSIPKKRKSNQDEARVTSPEKMKRKRHNAEEDVFPKSLSDWLPSASRQTFAGPSSNPGHVQQIRPPFVKQMKVPEAASDGVNGFYFDAAAQLSLPPSSPIASASASTRHVLSPLRGHQLHKQEKAVPLQVTTNTVRSPLLDHPHSGTRPVQDENSQPGVGSTSPIRSQVAKRAHYPSPPTSPLKLGENSNGKNHTSSIPVGPIETPARPPVDSFFRDAAFWVPPLKEKHPELPSMKAIVESGIRLHALHAFFNACRWNREHNCSIGACPPTRGIVLLDPEDGDGPGWMLTVLNGIRELETKRRLSDEPRKAIWIFNRRTFDAAKDVRSQVLSLFE